MARYLELAMHDDDILLKPPFDQFFNLVFAGDVAGLLLKVSREDIAGVFNIAGYNHSIREIAQTCIDVAGSGRLNLENQISTTTARSPKMLFDLNDKKIRRELGYNQRTGLHAGLSLMASKKDNKGCS